MATRSDNRSRGGGLKKLPRDSPVTVDEDQRRHLIECCAAFAAARFRPARPGGYRGRDLVEAEARIDAVLEKHRQK